MRRFALAASVLALAAVPAPLPAQSDDTLRIRVVDVGAGLCTVTRAPGGAVMVYDGGHWTGGRCLAAVQALVPGDTIELLVLSHSDSDHLGDVPAILGNYTVRRILWTGFRREDTATWRDANRAIAEEVLNEGASVRALSTHPLVPGEVIPLGGARVTLVAGWDRWPSPAGLSTPERRNVVSIVVRLDYRGAAVLYAGDTVGRRIGDVADACRDAEAFMVANHDAGRVPLQADVVIAPHHGADNGNSACFVRAVDPRWVVFSAGHDHEHPRAAAAARYLAHGVPPANLLRTDRGDDEGGSEWSAGRVSGCIDPRGDDDVEVRLFPDGTVRVEYVAPGSGC